ncbi:hypothetical protein JCM10213_004534 [Rhodosporidiobolus nylandii]
MEPPSSDGLEILSELPPRRPRPAGSSAAFAAVERQAAAHSSPARPAQLSNVIELSESEDEAPVQRAGRGGEDSDLEIEVLAGPSKPVKRARPALADPSSAASDDLPSATALWNSLAPKNAQPVARSLSMLVGTSASAGLGAAPLARARTLPTLNEFDDLPASAFSIPSGFSSSPASPPPAPPAPDKADPKGKGKRRMLFEKSDDPEPGDDLWADILGEPTPGKGAGKGKKKDEAPPKETARGKKRLYNAGSGSEDEAAAPAKKAASKAKPPRPSPPPDKQKKPPAAAPALSKTALKKQETADRMRLREANTLRAGDKKVSTAELTVHISGTAFCASDDEDSDDLYGPPAGGRKKGGKGKKKASPWVEISEGLRERLKLYDCDVECPEVPRRDLGCEGTMRWTRVCDRMWSEERRMFLPLADGERIVVEEDTRLIFLTATDLSLHIANSTLSTHIASIQSRLPPHVNLFILLYGLPSLFRDMERARQEAYRIQVRAASGDEAGAAAAQAKAKPAGIGQRQPSKDDLELEIMRMQVKSRCMIITVDKVNEAVDWLEQLSFDVGQKPYQRLKHSHIALLGTTDDSIKSGKDLQDTYIKMLASLPRCTEAVAKGIVAEYPTLRELYEGWAACRDEKERKDMLVGIGKGRNVDGTATHRLIGKTLSTTIYEVMTGRDPSVFL